MSFGLCLLLPPSRPPTPVPPSLPPSLPPSIPSALSVASHPNSLCFLIYHSFNWDAKWASHLCLSSSSSSPRNDVWDAVHPLTRLPLCCPALILLSWLYSVPISQRSQLISMSVNVKSLKVLQIDFFSSRGAWVPSGCSRSKGDCDTIIQVRGS